MVIIITKKHPMGDMDTCRDLHV